MMKAPSFSELYPQNCMPIAGCRVTGVNEFDLIREEVLLGYGYNTARAYWGDLEHWRDWCRHREPDVDPLDPTPGDVQGYLDALAESGYSPNTAARRLTAMRAFLDLVDRGPNPARLVLPVRRRRSSA